MSYKNKKIMDSKNVLLAMPKDYNLSALISKNLTHLGYNVVYISPDNYEKFKYDSIWQRLQNLYEKIIKGNKDFKNRLRKKHFFAKKTEYINTYDSYDFGLFIRADFFNDDIIEFSKKKCKKLVAYHYDGLNRNKSIFNKISFFDDFFVFNPSDIKLVNNLKFTTNFYFDFDNPNTEAILPQNDFYFLGSHHESRKELLFKLEKHLKLFSNNVKFNIVFDKADFDKIPEYLDHNIHCEKKIIDYEEYLNQTLDSKVMIDLVINEHNGLSFRLFESLKFRKKIITTNKSVINYPFYHSNNIFVLEGNNFKNLETFLNSPYVNLPQEIIEIYSFTNWFKNIFSNESSNKKINNG